MSLGRWEVFVIDPRMGETLQGKRDDLMTGDLTHSQTRHCEEREAMGDCFVVRESLACEVKRRETELWSEKVMLGRQAVGD
ncbi:hypothetical protein AMTR_s00121p00094270 [Amborella trichopoda]|uniref:Uncharacterized protein n=1 Tax=Amborella trichopoda TaxID=13333 RepID=W1NNX0_AMBTC|nr:hypothetical protein AMTR_s00121p00094270 [Amborella trichopoda]